MNKFQVVEIRNVKTIYRFVLKNASKFFGYIIFLINIFIKISSVMFRRTCLNDFIIYTEGVYIIRSTVAVPAREHI